MRKEIVLVDWNSDSETAGYYLFRDTSEISDISGMVPIATTPYSYYNEYNLANGTYFYVVVAENHVGNSSISNCESVQMEIRDKPEYEIDEGVSYDW